MNMKFRQFVLIPALLLVIGAGCGKTATNTNTAAVNDAAKNTNETTEEVDTSDWLTYENEEYGFSLKYPSDWEVNELDETTIGLVSPERKEIVLDSPSEPNSDFYLVINSPLNTTPYIEEDFKESLIAAAQKNMIKDLEFLNEKRAIFIEYNSFIDEDQFVQYLILNESMILSVAYSNNAQYREIVESITDSTNND